MKLHNMSELGVWRQHSKCDRLRGSDTHTFRPFISASDIIEIFVPDLCQIISLSFEGATYLQGLPVYRFVMTDTMLQSVDKSPENICFCLEDKDQFCHNNGVRDVSSCMKAPVVMSLPHFYQADPQFREYAQGLSPDRDLHTSVLYIEPQTGSPVKAAKRVQLNMHLKRMEGFHLVQNVSEGLFPLIWLEEAILVTDAMLAAVKQPLGIQRMANIVCLMLMVITTLTACFTLMTFICLNKIWCFHHVTTNQVTALFYKSSQEDPHPQVKTDVLSAVTSSPWNSSKSRSPCSSSEQGKDHHVTTNQVTELFSKTSPERSQVKNNVLTPIGNNPWTLSLSQSPSSHSDQVSVRHVTTNQGTALFSKSSTDRSQVKTAIATDPWTSSKSPSACSSSEQGKSHHVTTN